MGEKNNFYSWSAFYSITEQFYRKPFMDLDLGH